MHIGEELKSRGLISSEQLEQAIALTNGKRLDQIVVELGLVTQEQALRVLAEEYGMRFVDLAEMDVDSHLLEHFPTSLIFRHVLLPLSERNGVVEVATSDPFDLEVLDELRSVSGFQIKPVLACADHILQKIKANLGVVGDTINELVAQRDDDDGEAYLSDLAQQDSELAEQAQTASVIRLVNELLIEALELHASDVHIEPQEKGLMVRFRIDGLLRVQPMPADINRFYSAIVTRLKIMSRLNIAEKRLPQDGRIELKVAGRDIDVRVSIIPMLYGEGVVLRLLDKQRMVFDLRGMGMDDSDLRTFGDLISLPHGIILVTGPTGSGKTTTLYSALNEIKGPHIKIITVEDPVEYHTEGICQIQVHTKIGMTFAAGLRSILRHDPDVILIGEIRDYETAESAIQASLTGHLVFSTLHTNDAAGAFTRLIDMGVEPYLASSTVEGVMAQRLARKLCSSCKQAYCPAPGDLPPDFPQPFPPDGQVFRPVGCRECQDTGYKGRTGVFELLRTDDGIRQLCVERASSAQIRNYGLQHGLVTLRQNGWQLVLDGVTSIDEILRITKGM